MSLDKRISLDRVRRQVMSNQEAERVAAELEQLRAVRDVCRRIVDAQAEDEALWCPVGIVEAYVVQELRTLHRAVEGDEGAAAAVED